MIAFLLILATIQAAQVYPGENVTVYLDHPALLSVDDSCVYFAESLTNTLQAQPGNHTLHVGINCTAGVKTIKADGVELMSFEVLQPEEGYVYSYAAKLERENLKLRTEIASLKSELENLNKKLREYRSMYEKAESEKKVLEVEKRLMSAQIEKLKQRVVELRKELDSVESELKSSRDTIDDLRTQIADLSGKLAAYRTVALFILALFVGSYAALIVMSRK